MVTFFQCNTRSTTAAWRGVGGASYWFTTNFLDIHLTADKVLHLKRETKTYGPHVIFTRSWSLFDVLVQDIQESQTPLLWIEHLPLNPAKWTTIINAGSEINLAVKICLVYRICQHFLSVNLPMTIDTFILNLNPAHWPYFVITSILVNTPFSIPPHVLLRTPRLPASHYLTTSPTRLLWNILIQSLPSKKIPWIVSSVSKAQILTSDIGDFWGPQTCIRVIEDAFVETARACIPNLLIPTILEMCLSKSQLREILVWIDRTKQQLHRHPIQNKRRPCM